MLRPALTLLLITPALHAQTTLKPIPPATIQTIEATLDKHLLPPRNLGIFQVEKKQIFALNDTTIVPVSYEMPGSGGQGGAYACGLYFLAPNNKRTFIPTYNLIPDTFGLCGSLAAIALEDGKSPHPRLLLIYNAYEPPRHSWQQPIVLTWNPATSAYAVSPGMPEEGNDMSAHWTIPRVRKLLQNK